MGGWPFSSLNNYGGSSPLAGGDGGWGGGGEGGSFNCSVARNVINTNLLDLNPATSNGGGGGGGGYSGGGGGNAVNFQLGEGGGGGGSFSASPCTQGMTGYAGHGFAFIDGPLLEMDTINTTGAYIWAANGATYSTSGDYVFNDTTTCSTRKLHLVTSPCSTVTAVSDTVFACQSYTWPLNGVTYTQTGTYTTLSGCESGTLHLTLEKPYFTVQPGIGSVVGSGVQAVHSYKVAGAGATGFTYQWYSNTTQSNAGGTAIAGAQADSLQVTGQQVLYYYCTLTSSNGCVITSEPSGEINHCTN
jgi:hypothetical protein